MDPDDRARHLAIFHLPLHASLQALDEKYNSCTVELDKKKSSDAAFVKTRQAELDNTYELLIKEYIREECEKGGYQPREIFSHYDVQVKRYEAVPPIPSTNDENQNQATSIVQSVETGDELDVPDTKHGSFTMVIHHGNIFDIPTHSVIIHAVNCLGVWGSGFAAELKTRFPGTYQTYRRFCQSSKSVSSLVGRCLLLAPDIPACRHHPYWIACLFTSIGYGAPNFDTKNPGRCDPEDILTNTVNALFDLRSGLLRASVDPQYRSCKPGRLYSPKINSGHFRVPWKDTKEVIIKCFEDYNGTWTVLSPQT